jgi:hypothetical protein
MTRCAGAVLVRPPVDAVTSALVLAGLRLGWHLPTAVPSTGEDDRPVGRGAGT